LTPLQIISIKFSVLGSTPIFFVGGGDLNFGRIDPM